MEPRAKSNLRPRGHGRSIGLLLYGLGLSAIALPLAPEAVSTLRFGTLGVLACPTRVTLLAWGLIALSMGLVRIPATATRWRAVRLGLGSAGVVGSLLVWVSMGQRLEILGVLAQSFRLATPVTLGALAGVLCERSGVINIGLEGMMLSAACLGCIAALYTAQPWVGVGMAALVGGVLAAGHALLVIHGRVDQIISGMVVNVLAVGLTGFLRRAVLLHNPRSTPAVLPTWPVPGLSELPVVGPLLFRHQPLVYASWLLVALLHLGLWYTTWGLRTRAIGEQPQASETVGVSVLALRYGNVVASGMVAGLAGAWFSLETVGGFDDMMTGGKGFIALAAMIFGAWQPVGALGGALVFGLVDALQIKLQIIGVQLPYQWLSMTPYVVTMLLLAGVVRRAVPPAALGRPSIQQG